MSDEPLAAILAEARKQIHDPTGSEWHANGKLLYTKDNDFIGEMEHSDDARFVCDAVNNAPMFDILKSDYHDLMKDVNRLRSEHEALKTSYNELHSELADKTRNYEDVIAYHRRTEESLRDIVRRLLPLAETTVENIRALGTARFPFLEQIKSDRLRGDINREVENADHLLREARAALGAGETPTGKGVGR